jgi:hypothetical protein
MRVEPQIFAFEFEARIETNPVPTGSAATKEDDKPVVTVPAPRPEDLLNKRSDEIARDLEKEIKHLFRSSVTVQAEVTFQEGSIIATGAIVVIKWLGPVAVAAAKKAVETEFSGAIKVLIKRVLQRWLGLVVPNFHAVVEGLEVNSQDTGPLPSPAETRRWRNDPNLLVVANTVMLLIVLAIQLLVIFKQLRP